MRVLNFTMIGQNTIDFSKLNQGVHGLLTCTVRVTKFQTIIIEKQKAHLHDDVFLLLRP